MVDTTTPEVATNSEPVESPTPDPELAAQDTPATDTRPPEQKEEKAETPPAPEPEKPKRAHTRKASAKKTETPDEDHDWEYTPPTAAITTRLQRALGRHGFYTGPADGDFEKKSIQGVQRAIALVGYEGAITGHIGEAQARLIQVFAKEKGTYTGPINKKIDANTWVGFVIGLERLK